MEIKEWVERIRKLKTAKYAGFNNLNIMCKVNAERDIYTLISREKCRHCGAGISRELIVKFKEPQKFISIFEAELLFLVFVLNKKPRDYAGFHKCPAGKKFIENIENIIGGELKCI